MKIKTKVRGVGLGGQGGCKQRIEVFAKIQKKNKKIGGVYEEVKLYRGDPVGGGRRGLVGSKVGGSG